MKAVFRVLLATAGLGMLLQTSHLAIAQIDVFRTAGEKITGEAYWPSRAMTRHVESARAYTQEFHSYVSRASRPEPAVVAEVSKTLNNHLDEANKHLTSIKKDFAGDKETASAIENIEKDLTKAADHHKAMVASCQNDKFDKAAAMTCCTDLAKHLEKIQADNSALMKKLAEKHRTSSAAK